MTVTRLVCLVLVFELRCPPEMYRNTLSHYARRRVQCDDVFFPLFCQTLKVFESANEIG